MSISVETFKEQMEKIVNLRTKEAEAHAAKKLISEELENEETIMLNMLVAEGLNQFRGPLGLVSLSFKTSVKTPKTDEDKAAFYEHLKSEELYDDMISVNSMTLNSYYKSKLAEAEAKERRWRIYE